MKPTHLLAATLLTALILACFSAPAAALSGSGTASDPYIITTEAELYSINDIGTTSTYFELGNDISISTYQFTSSYAIIDGAKFKEINGAGFTIDFSNAGIYTASGNNYAYFSINISADSVIKNLKVKSFKINYGFGAWGSQMIRDARGTLSNIIIEDCIINGGLASSVANSGSDVSSGNINNMIVISSTFNANYNGVSNNGGYLYSAIFSSGEIKQGVYTGQTIPLSVSNSISISSSVQPQTTGNYNHAVVIGNGYSGGSGFTHTNNYNYNTRVSGNLVSSNDANGVDGKTTNDISESWFKSTFTAWDWENVWQWNDETNLPELRNANNQKVIPTISAISATPATGGQQTEYTLSVTATTEAAGGIASYQWSYSTDSGQTWQPIPVSTTATYVWTPGTSISGTVLLKCYITGADGGTVDSYDAGYTSIQITVYPPPDISTISVSRPLQKVNTPTTLTATLTESEPATYQWYYSTNGGTTWQPISGATALTAEYTPTTTGTHSVKIVVTNQYGESNELTTNFNVLPTYTPTPITNTSVDISIDSTAKYQGMQQFTLSAELKALNYYTPNLAHIAHDNALYYLDSAEREVIPVSTTTGGTISAAYIGQYTGVITDTSGNTAFYFYQTNDWQYIEQNSAAIIASTSSYAATVSGGTLRIYNLNGNLVANTTTTAANLAGNDATNVFVSYNDKTLTYYWVNGNSISSASQTLTHSITELHQITGTGNFIISTAANTYIVEITDAGVYSIITTSDTDTPLLNTQSTSINVFIGTSGNEIYIIGADGETDGTYVSGSTLMDASISKATGLYALAGGADYQVYILAKSQSSTWQLQQVVAFGSAIDFSQISTTGTYAAISTGLKLYLLEAVDVSTGTYMLQGAVIGSSGSPYAGKLVTINGDQIRTDTSGRFLYPVSPGTLYTIIADTTEVEYTATNAALQQIAIKMKPNPYAQSVSYSAEYNEDTSSFEMQYEDQTGKTESVTWVIRESGNSTTVWTGTSTPGQTISWEVPFDKVFTGYQISMIADRSGSNVENVWMITPAGSQPIDIGGLDDTGKNIIFGCVLMVLAGLFGVMYSTKGALFIVLAAGVMVFLGLLTIPWEVIIVAGLLAVLALLAKGGGGS